jgi:flagellar motor component MotA
MSVGNGLTAITGINVKKRLGISHFVSESLVGLGLLGTVVGLIYMVFDSLGSEASSNIQKTIESLKLGLATALITTGVGLICSIFLNIQSYIISYELEDEN